MEMERVLWVGIAIGLVFSNWVVGYEQYHFNETELSLLEAHEASLSYAGTERNNLLLVGLTLIQNAAAKGAGNNLISISTLFYLFIVL